MKKKKKKRKKKDQLKQKLYKHSDRCYDGERST